MPMPRLDLGPPRTLLGCNCGWTGTTRDVLIPPVEPETWVCPRCLAELVKNGAPATASHQNETQH